MDFHLLTLFPDVLQPYFQESILGRAQEKKLIRTFCHDLRAYAPGKHQSVDDSPYGGGAGMVMRPEVVVGAVRDLKARFSIDRVIYLSPRGILFSHAKAKELSTTFSSVLLLCGRYEGVDQRAIDLVVDEEMSIGDYVLTGGELAAAVVVDAVARLIPQVVGDIEGPQNDSHAEGLLDHPHYTRPFLFEGVHVPSVLISGNHAEIERWRRKESLCMTLKNRPDLIDVKNLSREDRRLLDETK